MNKKRFVIPSNHIPTRSPLLASVVLYMALDMYKAPAWLQGALWMLAGIIWLIWVIVFFEEEPKPMQGYGEQKGKE